MIIAVVDETWREEVVKYVSKKAYLYDIKNDCSFIGFVEDNKVIGGLLFTDYDSNNIYIHLALDHPRICQKRFIKLMFSYCFNQLRCGRVTACTVDGAKRTEKLIEGIGFVKEGVVRKAFKRDSDYVDTEVYGMLKNECKWI